MAAMFSVLGLGMGLATATVSSRRRLARDQGPAFWRSLGDCEAPCVAATRRSSNGRGYATVVRPVVGD